MLTDKQLSEATFPVNFECRPGPDINGRDMIMNMFVHVAHHRAQCEVYLRLKGITPPIYTFSRVFRVGVVRTLRFAVCTAGLKACTTFEMKNAVVS
jgi:hypothetical protein